MLSIDRLAAGGDGIGRLADGRVVFVPFTAPGDRVRVRIEEERARFARASLLSVIEPGAGRRRPPCPVFGDCGGCDWQHLDYASQIDAKRSILTDALKRLGHVSLPATVAMVESPAEYGYRSRARVLASPEGVGFRRRRSHDVCPIDACPVLMPALDRELARLAREGPRAAGEARELDLALGSDGTVRVTSCDGESGATLPIEICGRGERIRVSAGVFAQANGLLVDALVSAVVAAAAAGPRGRLLELYAGAGLFTLPLARDFREVVAVESSARAAADLEYNAAAAGLADRIRVLNARAEDVLDLLADLEPDTLALDPPRQGLARGLPERLAALGAQRIAYLSCNPATLARDVGLLCRRGYRLERLTGFDLFPQTAHVEALAELVRRDGSEA